MKPFSLELNAAVMTMANHVLPKGWDIAGIDTGYKAPTCLGELNDLVMYEPKRIIVDGANSDDTIFGDAEHNYAFRAWHDWTHWHIQAEFNLAGEVAVAIQQHRDLAKIYGSTFADRYKALLFAEVIGQALARELTGEFPEHQRAFDDGFMLLMSRGFGEGMSVRLRRCAKQ